MPNVKNSGYWKKAVHQYVTGCKLNGTVLMDRVLLHKLKTPWCIQIFLYNKNYKEKRKPITAPKAKMKRFT